MANIDWRSQIFPPAFHLLEGSPSELFFRAQTCESTNPAYAKELYRTAASQQHPRAMVQLGRFFLRENDRMGASDAKAVWLFQQAVALGDSEGMLFLGRMYSSGRGGLQQNNAEAARQYAMSSTSGNADGTAALADMYFHGRGVPQDQHKAIQLYLQAAEHHSIDAMNVLGILFYYGMCGFRQDIARTIQLFTEGVTRGDPFSIQYLAYVYSMEGIHYPDSRETARLKTLSVSL